MAIKIWPASECTFLTFPSDNGLIIIWLCGENFNLYSTHRTTDVDLVLVLVAVISERWEGSWHKNPGCIVCSKWLSFSLILITYRFLVPLMGFPKMFMYGAWCFRVGSWSDEVTKCQFSVMDDDLWRILDDLGSWWTWGFVTFSKADGALCCKLIRSGQWMVGCFCQVSLALETLQGQPSLQHRIVLRLCLEALFGLVGSIIFVAPCFQSTSLVLPFCYWCPSLPSILPVRMGFLCTERERERGEREETVDSLV